MKVLKNQAVLDEFLHVKLPTEHPATCDRIRRFPRKGSGCGAIVYGAERRFDAEHVAPLPSTAPPPTPPVIVTLLRRGAAKS